MGDHLGVHFISLEYNRFKNMLNYPILLYFAKEVG